MFFLYIIILINTVISVPAYSYIRCDDYLEQIKVNDVPITLVSQQTGIGYNYQGVLFEVNYGDKITFVCRNGGGPTGLTGTLNINGNVFETDNSTGNWSWNNTGTFHSNFNGVGMADDLHNLTTTEYYFQMPIYQKIKAEDFGFALEMEGITSQTKEINMTIQFLNHLTIEDNSTNNLLQVVFEEIPFPVDFIKHLTPPDTEEIVQNNTKYSFHNNNIYVRDKFVTLTAFRHQVYKIKYHIVNVDNNIISNTATLTIAICDLTGTIHCDYRKDVFENEPYYIDCKTGYSFLEVPHSRCLPNNQMPENYYSDSDGIYKPCYPSCKQCAQKGTNFNNQCDTTIGCATGFHPFENMPKNCISNVDTNSIELSVGGKYKGKGSFIYFDDNWKYYSFINTSSCGGDYPYQLDNTENTKVCLSKCSKFGFVQYNGQCLSVCPSRYTSIGDGFCAEITLLDNPVKSYRTTNEDKAYIFTNIKYNLNFYLSLKTDIKGSDFTLQVYDTFGGPNLKDSIPYADFSPLESKLRTQKLRQLDSISKSEKIYVVKMDMPKSNEITDQVEYILLRENGDIIDLSAYEDDTIVITYPIKNTESLHFEEAKNLSLLGINLYDKNDRFYNDYCLHYSIDGYDLDLEARRNLYYTNIKVCEEGCTFESIDFINTKVNCRCKVKTSVRLTTLSNIYNKEGTWNDTIKNQNLFDCIDTIWEWNNLKNNIGFIIYCIFFGIELLLLQLYLIFENHKVNELIFKTKENNDDDRKIIDTSESFQTDIEENKQSLKVIVRAPPVNPIDTYGINYIIKTGRVENDIINEKPPFMETDSSMKEKNKEIKEEEIKSLPVTVHNSVTLFGYIIMKKTRILNVIIVHRKYFFPFFNLSVSILELSINFFFNSLFFTGKLISDKYKDGKISFLTKLKIILIVNIITRAIMLLIDRCNTFMKVIEFMNIKETKENEFHLIKRKFSYISSLQIIFYFIIQFGFIVFSLFYVSLFCIMYHCAQKDWIINCLLSLCLSLVVSFLISLVVTIIYSIVKCIKHQYINNLLVFIYKLL